jgi:hypothetical protein
VISQNINSGGPFVMDFCRINIASLAQACGHSFVVFHDWVHAIPPS